MKKFVTILAILALILGLAAGVSFFILKKEKPDVREQELQTLESESEPVITTIGERGADLKMLESQSKKPVASVEARINELNPVLE